MTLHRVYAALSFLLPFAGLSLFWAVVALAPRPDPFLAFITLIGGLLAGLHFVDKAEAERRALLLRKKR